MSLNKLLHYLGKVAYQRGKEYYMTNAILSYKEKEFAIEAETRGRGKGFKVQIQLDEHNNIKRTDCSCPLWDRCKHVAAVLIHFYASHYDLRLGDGSSEIKKEEKESAFRIAGDQPPGQELLRLLEKNDSLYVNPVLESDMRQFKLAFRLRNAGFNPREIFNWEISPVLVYIKKDGSLGSVYSYSPRKRMFPFSLHEQELLSHLKDHDGRKDSFIYYAYMFIAHPGMSLYLFSGHTYKAASFHKVQKITFSFEVEEVEDRSLFCIPHWEFTYGEDLRISTAHTGWDLLKYGERCFLIFESGRILYLEGPGGVSDFFYSLVKEKSRFSPGDIKYLKNYIEQHYKDTFSVHFPIRSVKVITESPSPVVEVKENNLLRTLVSFIFVYRDHECPFSRKNKILTISHQEEETLLVKRDLKQETNFIVFFEKNVEGDIFNRYSGSSEFILDISMRDFLVKYGKLLINAGFVIRMGRDRRIQKSKGKFSFFAKSGINWFDLKLKYSGDSEDEAEQDVHVSLEDLDKGLVKVGQGYVILDEKELARLKELAGEGLTNEGDLKVNHGNLYLLDQLYDDISKGIDKKLKRYRDIFLKLKDTSRITDYPLPENFQASLRHYQQTGYNWLRFLFDNKIGGCLADDMGLGKTVQALGFLQYLKEAGKLSPGLLVVPVTLMANWEKEAARFAPSLKILRHAGADRSLEKEAVSAYDLIAVSYQTLRIDIEFFQKFKFGVILLDESQNIKNAFSKTYGAIRQLKSKHRISLTGTPVENSTLELWSQMEFLNPGLLPGINDFKEKYTIPIEEFKDKDVTEKLRKIIYPFVLRRTKEEVMTELPEKEVEVYYTDMNLAHKEAYRQLKATFGEKVKNMLENKGLQKSRFEIFSAILKLRLMSLFPHLVSPDYSEIRSSKFEILKDMLSEILEENHKVLIFSQFVKVLKIVREHLESQNIQHSYIDGSTRNREGEIFRFQENPDCRVFLLSLKAGGTGINLTAADYVILFDPWWNPAVENQAFDRAHRMGQTRKVLGYKFIVKDSIEEKILALQEKKRELVENLISEDTLKSLSETDIMELFS